MPVSVFCLRCLWLLLQVQRVLVNTSLVWSDCAIYVVLSCGAFPRQGPSGDEAWLALEVRVGVLRSGAAQQVLPQLLHPAPSC